MNNDDECDDANCIHCVIGRHLTERGEINFETELSLVMQAVADIICSAEDQAERKRLTLHAFKALGEHLNRAGGMRLNLQEMS